MIAKSVLVISLLTISIAAIPLSKRDVTPEERPETPLLANCEEPGENRENCFIQDPSNLDIYKTYLEDIDLWEKKYPSEAKKFNSNNPNMKKQEAENLAELEKFAKFHDE